jgi:hypothetical protein
LMRCLCYITFQQLSVLKIILESLQWSAQI